MKPLLSKLESNLNPNIKTNCLTLDSMSQLNFWISGSEKALEDIIAAVKCTIQYLQNASKEVARNNVNNLFPRIPLMTPLKRIID